MDRVIAGLCAGFMRPIRLIRSAIVPKPSTILAFHQALKKRKYCLLFSPKQRGRPGPKGPAPELIEAVVENDGIHGSAAGASPSRSPLYSVSISIRTSSAAC